MFSKKFSVSYPRKRELFCDVSEFSKLSFYSSFPKFFEDKNIFFTLFLEKFIKILKTIVENSADVK